MTQPYADRLFLDGDTQFHQEIVRAKAAARFGTPAVWVVTDRVGPSGKPYSIIHLGVVEAGRVIAVAYPTRSGAVKWRDPQPTTRPFTGAIPE